MPISPARMPCLAVAGELIHFRERMNNALAMRYTTSMTYWLAANSGVILRLRPLRFCRTAGFKHLQHAVGNEESAHYVAGRSDNCDHSHHGCVWGTSLAHEDNRAHNSNCVQRVREGHQRRMQQWRHVTDHFKSDKGRQHEYEQCVDQVRRHANPSSQFSVASSQSVELRARRSK